MELGNVVPILNVMVLKIDCKKSYKYHTISVLLKKVAHDVKK